MQDKYGRPLGKPFDPELYDKCTIKAFDAIEKEFKFLKLTLMPEDFGIDVLIYLTEEDRMNWGTPIAALELEIKEHMTEWTRESGYPTTENFVRFLLRKMRFLREEKLTSFYLMYNPTCDDSVSVELSKLRGYNPTLGTCRWGKDGFIDREKNYLHYGPENLESLILKHIISVANKFCRGFFGSDLVDISKITDYIQFTKDNMDLVRKMAEGVNAVHREIHWDGADRAKQKFNEERIEKLLGLDVIERSYEEIKKEIYLESQFELDKEIIYIETDTKYCFENSFDEYGVKSEKKGFKQSYQ